MHVGVAAIKTALAQRRELRPLYDLGCLVGMIATRIENPLRAGFKQPAHAHEFAFRGPNHRVGASHAQRAHQRNGGLDAVAVVLHVHPDAVEAHETRHLIDRWIGKVQRRQQHCLVLLQFRFNS